MQRMDAAMALSVLRRREAVDALVRSLDDPAEPVRPQAARSFLVIYDLTGEADVMMKDREHTIFRVMSSCLAKRESGKRDILAAIAGLPIPTFMPS